MLRKGRRSSRRDGALDLDFEPTHGTSVMLRWSTVTALQPPLMRLRRARCQSSAILTCSSAEHQRCALARTGICIQSGSPGAEGRFAAGQQPKKVTRQVVSLSISQILVCLHHHRLTKLFSGRLIASQFLTLPPRDELPDYYDFTKLPIAIDTIEDKLNDGGYKTVTEVESDFKRMVQNAKDYNNNHSEIYEDAERIRKLVYNYMKQHNPAYNEDSNYTSFPTPIPKAVERRANGGTDGHGANGRSTETPSRQRKPTAAASSEPPDRRASIMQNGTDGEHESGVNFTGLGFQDAQQTIIDALLKYTDDE